MDQKIEVIVPNIFAAYKRNGNDWIITTKSDVVSFKDNPILFANYTSDEWLYLANAPIDGGPFVRGDFGVEQRWKWSKIAKGETKPEDVILSPYMK